MLHVMYLCGIDFLHFFVNFFSEGGTTLIQASARVGLWSNDHDRVAQAKRHVPAVLLQSFSDGFDSRTFKDTSVKM